MGKTILALSLLSMFGCSQMALQKNFVKVVFSNASSQALNWVALEVGEKELNVGVLIPNKDTILLQVDWSNIPERGTVTFIDDKSRQPYKIAVSLADVNKQVNAGNCRTVTIRILGYDKAEIACQ